MNPSHLEYGYEAASVGGFFHRADGGLRVNFRYQAIALIDP